MTNIILLVKDRVRLTEQCLRTLYEETPRDQFNLVIVDDGSWPETAQILARYSRRDNCEVVTFLRSVGIVGFLRNVGVWTSERYFGRGDYLCLIDNDIAMLHDWLPKMIEALDHVWTGADDTADTYKVLGGYRHPFHGVNHTSALVGMGRPDTTVEETDAVAGYMHFMKWSTWDDFGPYDQHAKGVCQSEDFAFCQAVKRGNPVRGVEQTFADIVNGKVGYIHPPVIANCGITNSEGKPAIGSESFPRIAGLIYE